MSTSPSKYGFRLSEVKETSHIYGSATSLPFPVVQSDGDWTPSLPVKEFQNLNNVEPYACVIFTLLNCVETLIKKKYGLDRNYSDRFLACAVDTRDGGCSPDDACEFLRKIGVVPQEIWPFDETIDTQDKFFAELPEKLIKLAEEFKKEWDFKHKFVASTHEAITGALTCSPLLVSFWAWQEKNGLYVRPKRLTDNHATTMFYQKEGEFRRVFDSYDSPHIKDLQWSDIPMEIKVFSVKKKIEGDSTCVQVFLKRLFSMLKLQS